jgi:hypothetical protein
MKPNSSSTEWPSLPYEEWAATRDTLHLWTQIVGKTRLELCAPQNHWWHVPLYVTARGLGTAVIPSPAGSFDVEFDFVEHHLAVRSQSGRARTMGLYPRSVADFFAEYMSCLGSIGVEPNIFRKPQEVEDTTPFDQDRHHASYDRDYVERFHGALQHADRLMKEFRSGFLGKCSPVHFFWGSFDMAVTRFSGRPAQLAATADRITREAYSHEVSSCGFWPGDHRFPHPAYYAYMAPSPAGLEKEPVSSGGWNSLLGEHVLEYQKARQLDSPDQAVRSFFEDTYAAGARLANWDRAALERHK